MFVKLQTFGNQTRKALSRLIVKLIELCAI